MNNIQKLSLAAALAAVLTTTASAFPYAQPHFGAPNYSPETATSFALYVHGQSSERIALPASSKAPVKSGKSAQSK
jgi:hypothetical protein